MDATILFFFLVHYALANEQPEFIQKLLGMGKFQIGMTIGETDCYLTWYETAILFKDDEKETHFKCGVKRGSEFRIKIADNNRYWFQTILNRKYWYWLGQEGNTKPLQFRSNKGDDTFLIREKEDGKFSFAAVVGGNECPLFWKHVPDSTDFPAEFRCNPETKEDTFWIKGDCIAKTVETIRTDKKLNSQSKEVIGISTDGMCSTSSYNTLTLHESHEVNEELSIEFSKSKEINWERSASVSVSGSGEVMGIGVETEVSATVSYGGSKTFGFSRTKSTGSSTTRGSSSQVHFNTPGAAIVIGFVTRYEINNDNVPVKVTAQCKNGYQYTYDTTIKLKSTLFGDSKYRSHTVLFKKGKCTREYLNCMDNITYELYSDVNAAIDEFQRCFPIDSIEKKKKKKIGKGKSSSKSENKESKKSAD